MTDLLPDTLPTLEELSAEPFGTEVTSGGRQPKEGLRKHFTEADKDRVLMVLMRLGGDSKRAAELCGVRYATIQKWKNDLLADRYHELRVRYGQQLEEARIQDIQELVDAYSEAERAVVFRLRDEVDNLDPRDLAKAAQSLAVAKDKNIRDYLTLQGRPVQVTEQRNPDAALERLRELGVVDVEPIEAKVVEDA